MIEALVIAAFAGPDPLLVPRDIEFNYSSKTKVNSVSVAGTFNQWDQARNPMTLGADGTWRTTIKIIPGIYTYRLVVNGNTWITDPSAPTQIDLNSNTNSLLVVRPECYDTKPGKKGDGQITTEVLLHRPNNADTVRRTKNTITINLRTRNLDIDQVRLNIHGQKPVSMERIESNELYDTWQCVAKASNLEKLTYDFELKDGKTVARFPDQPFVQNVAAYPLPSPPNWVQKSVFYQIFPDRFAIGGTAAKDYPKAWFAEPAERGFQGGNLNGISEKLGYIADLGATGLFLNPIFATNTYHGYNTLDYEKIEPRFGTNADFASLVKALHSRGIKVMLDGVFNHCGSEHPYFLDVIKNEKKSEYYPWFTVYKFPIKVEPGQQTYLGWAGVYGMPKLKTSNPVVQSFVANVGQHWIKRYNIDAWRLDVADEVDPECWRVFRRAVRGVDKNAYILGEAWGDARTWVQGDQHDATMNYRWRTAVMSAILDGSLSPTGFDRALRIVREQIPEATVLCQYNLLSSHDTPRFLTLAKGDKRKLRQAMLFQMTYPGVPSVYYGEEIGMEGGHDPDCRRGMIWDQKKWDHALLSDYKAAIKRRKSTAALCSGSFRTLLADDPTGLFAYERKAGKSRVVVVMNLGKSQQDVPAQLVQGLTLAENSECVQRKNGGVSLKQHGIALLIAP